MEILHQWIYMMMMVSDLSVVPGNFLLEEYFRVFYNKIGIVSENWENWMSFSMFLATINTYRVLSLREFNLLDYDHGLRWCLSAFIERQKNSVYNENYKNLFPSRMTWNFYHSLFFLNLYCWSIDFIDHDVKFIFMYRFWRVSSHEEIVS